MDTNFIRYGSYPSEQNKNKYFEIILARSGKVIKTQAVLYPYSVYLSDVAVHTFREKEDGGKCAYSPTGFCGCYDEVKHTSTGCYFSPRIVVEMLIERLEKVVKLTSHEIRAIRNMIYNEIDLFENEEKMV